MHKTVLPVRNIGEKMLFALLEAMFSENESLSSKLKSKDEDTCILRADIAAPSQKPMLIEVKLVEKSESEESKQDEEDEVQYISFKQVGEKQESQFYKYVDAVK